MAEPKHKLDWGAVRMSALIHGVREAARIHGASEAAALKRSQREGWLKDPAAKDAALQAVKQRALPVVSQPSIVTMSEAFVAEMKALNKKSRLSLARGVNHAATRIEEMPGQAVLEHAHNVKAITSAGDIVHGWKNETPTTFRLCLEAMDTSDIQIPVPEVVPDDDGVTPSLENGGDEWKVLGPEKW